MISTSEVRKSFKIVSARAWVDGQPVTLTEDLPTRTLSALRGRSTCALGVRNLPPSSGKPAQVDIVVNGQSQRFFTGLTAERSAVAATAERSANLVDLLDLNKALPAAITWEGTAFPDAVRDLLQAVGIDDADVDSIFDPGANYTLGPVYPITLETTENISSIFRELMEFGGCAAYVTPSGRVRVVDSPGIPATTSALIYAEGADLDAGELGIFDAGVQLEGDETIVSIFTATGPKRPDGAIPDGTFTATNLVGKPDGRQFRFLQTDAAAAALSERELKRRARARMNLWVLAPLNVNVLPGDTILVRIPRVDLSSNTPAYVMEAATTGDAAMRLVVSLGPSLVDGYAISITPPEVDFAMRVEHQLVTLEGVPVGSYLVQCQDMSRDRNGRTITGLSWAAAGPGASPTSSSDSAPIFLFTDLAGATISLTATSSSGEEATISRTPVANELQVLTRVVSAATSSGWRVLANLQGWRQFAAPGGANCTAVPAFNEVGPLLSGWSSGAIYATLDALATSPTLLSTLSGAIGALFVNEGDLQELLAGHGDTLSRSQDGGTTWAAIGTFDGAVTDCQSSPSNPNEIRVTAGEAMHVSYDGGANWAVAAQGIAGSTAEALATAPWGRAAAFSGVGSNHIESIKFEEAYGVDWTTLDPADLPADGLASITPLLEEEGYIAGEAKDLIRDGALSALVLTAGAGALYKLSWTGTHFAVSLLPPAAGSGAGKLVTQLAHYPIDATSATSIGYGPLAAPPRVVVATLLILPSSGTVWYRREADGTYTEHPIPENPGWDRDRLVASPLNPNHLLVSYTAYTGQYTRPRRIYLSTDGGDTWTLAREDTSFDRSWMEFSATVAGRWWTSQLTQRAYFGHFANIVRGDLASTTLAYESGFSDATAYLQVAPGLANELIVASESSGWFDGALHLSPSPPPWSRPGHLFGSGMRIDRLPLTRRTILADGGLWRSEDYRDPSLWQQVAGVATGNLALLADGTAVCRVGASFVEVADVFGAASVATPELPPVGYSSFIRSDRQTQTIVVTDAEIDGNTHERRIVIRQPSGLWEQFDYPPAINGAAWIEPVTL